MSVAFELDGKSFELDGRFCPSTPDVRYMRNGDPGDPGDPAEFEPIRATVNGDPIDLKAMDDGLFDEMIAAAIEACEEQCGRDEGPDDEDDDREITWIH